MIHGVSLVDDKKKEAEKWELLDHVCGTCFGRLLSRPADDGMCVFQCSNCGTTIISLRVEDICACGIKVNPGATEVKIRCLKNDNVTPKVPSVIIAKVIQ